MPAPQQSYLSQTGSAVILDIYLYICFLSIYLCIRYRAPMHQICHTIGMQGAYKHAYGYPIAVCMKSGIACASLCLFTCTIFPPQRTMKWQTWRERQVHNKPLLPVVIGAALHGCAKLHLHSDFNSRFQRQHCLVVCCCEYLLHGARVSLHSKSSMVMTC